MFVPDSCSPTVGKSKHVSCLERLFWSSFTNTNTSWPTASQPQLLNFPPLYGWSESSSMFSGVAITPPEVPAMNMKWFGYEGPATDAKKWSDSAYSFAHCQ